jgi:RNA polymerase sigma factor (sigma-70 family)
MSIRNPATSGCGAVSEAALFQQAQAGCQDSLNVLMARHEGLVQAVVRHQVLGDLSFSEALHAGRIGLWRAVLGFDPSRGFAFSTYAWPAIQRRVWRAVKSNRRLHTSSEIPESLLPLLGSGSGAVPSSAPDPAQAWEAVQVHRALHTLLQCLTPRLRRVTVARYGLNGHPPSFYRQIGAALGLCGERARQLHTQALVWLRHPAHSYALRSLLGRHALTDYQEADAMAQRWLRRRGGRHG